MRNESAGLQRPDNNGTESANRKFTVRTAGKDSEPAKTLKEIRCEVQRILDRSLKISTLIGSGASYGAIPLMGQTFQTFKEDTESGALKDDFDSVFQKFKAPPQGSPNRENDIEAFMTWLSQRTAIVTSGEKDDKYSKVLSALLSRFNDSVRQVDYETGEDSVDKVKRLYQRFIQGLGYSREILARRERTIFDVVNLFTTNYDLFHEYALLESGFLYTDGFSDGLKNEFSAKHFHRRPVDLDDRFRDRVQPVNPFFRLFKLHGSVDWIQLNATASRPHSTVRISQFHSKNTGDSASPDCANASLIKPMSSKYVLTQGEPFSDLFREFVNILGEPDTVLFVAGYGFGDEHVNNLIYHALQRSDFLLYAFVENPSDGPAGLNKFIAQNSKHNAIFVYPNDTSTPGRFMTFAEVVDCFAAESTGSINTDQESGIYNAN
ncbi:SIR2 family protein [Corynebacterium mendelii]|uniref:SIR2 family protein n=1 Tax=Corynebacterium mendelii TaxID=2765362 RepID=A0A939DZ15_9CORY|nr:SIR2 family protein [Corynebacterium mendelii]MBN9643648.1 SIR2 family protein [Corynebacterium mendelii]